MADKKVAIVDAYSNGPVWNSFGLTYAAYFCVPRTVLCSMPLEWQEQFIKLTGQLPDTPTYRCLRIDENTGKFARDELRNYRHPANEVRDRLAKEIEFKRKVEEEEE